MNRSDLLNDKAFWSVLETLLSKDKSYTFGELEKDLEIGHDEVMALCSFLKNIGVEVSINDEKVRVKGLSKFQWSLSLMDWIAFQAHFPFLLEHSSAPYHKFLKRFLASQEIKLASHDFFEAFATLEKSFQDRSNQSVKILEKAILEKSALRLKLMGRNRNIYCFPYRLSYLDNELNLVTEDGLDKTLLTIPINKISDVKVADEPVKPNHGVAEVTSFISSLRQFSDTEQHLVLKIFQPNESINLNPEFHFFRNASLLRSSRGDYIWSAYVEPGDKLYGWLEDLWKNCQFDILAPLSLAEDFDEYLYNKMKFSKVS